MCEWVTICGMCMCVCVWRPKVCNAQRATSQQRVECDLTSLIETSRAAVKYRLTEEEQETETDREAQRERGEERGEERDSGFTG